MFKARLKRLSARWCSGAAVNLAGTPRLLEEIVNDIHNLRQRWTSAAGGTELVNGKNCYIEEAGSTGPLKLVAREMAK